MKKIIVYRAHLLPISETFIWQQARSLTRWHPIIAGDQRLSDGLLLDGLETLVLRDKTGRVGNWLYRACRLLRLPHPPTLRKLRRLGASLVHVHFGTDAVDIWPQVRALGLPMLVTLHGYDINTHRAWWEAGHGGKRRRHYPKQLLQLAREPNVRFIAVSEAIKARAIGLGIPQDKINVRYIGIDTQTFSPGECQITQRAKRVLFVGRLVEKKGVDHLIRSFSEVCSQIKDAELVVAGEGPKRAELEQLATDLGVPVQFLGRCTSDEIRQQLDRSRLLCLPSVLAASGDAEGFGMVLLEAQACGVPVVTSARGGATEAIVDTRTGFAFAEKDQRALAANIVRILGDDELIKRMSDEAVTMTRARFEIQQLTALLEADYDGLLANHVPRAT